MFLNPIKMILLASVLFLSSIHPGILVSEDYIPSASQKGSINENLPLLYLSCANANLIAEKYEEAFDDYQRTYNTSSLADSGVKFLIAFGMAIVSDNLNLTECCQQSISQIRSLIESDDKKEDGFLEYISPDSTVLNYLKGIACMASSKKIRNELLMIIDEIFPSSILSSSFLYESDLRAMPCKSFWKRMETLAHNIWNACDKVLNIIERCLDIYGRVNGSNCKYQNIPSLPPKNYILVKEIFLPGLSSLYFRKEIA